LFPCTSSKPIVWLRIVSIVYVLVKVRRLRQFGTGLLLTLDDGTLHIHLRLQLIRHWVQARYVSVKGVLDYFLGASAF
jgi:hypothetical protein